ncbi:nitroreductase family protein [Chloroflexota bacterium]
MQIDEFLDLARKRRSIRRFKPDPIPDEYIEKMLEVARWAMSGANAQPWEFIVVKDRQTINTIAGLWKENQKRVWDIEKTRIKELRHRGFVEGPASGPPGFIDAPALIVVCGDPRTVQATVLNTHFLANDGGPGAHFLKNMANATQLLHLAAAALGLGAQWISVNCTYEPRLKALLDVPVELAIHNIVPVGYPAYEAPAPYRRELKEIIHFEKYDGSRYRSGEDIFNYLLDLRRRTEAAYKLKDKSKGE